jgi:hypothetical protein
VLLARSRKRGELRIRDPAALAERGVNRRRDVALRPHAKGAAAPVGRRVERCARARASARPRRHSVKAWAQVQGRRQSCTAPVAVDDAIVACPAHRDVLVGALDRDRAGGRALLADSQVTAINRVRCRRDARRQTDDCDKRRRSHAHKLVRAALVVARAITKLVSARGKLLPTTARDAAPEKRPRATAAQRLRLWAWLTSRCV